MLAATFERAGRGHAFMMFVDELHCGAAAHILLLDATGLPTALEDLRAGGRAEGLDVRTEVLEPAELRWCVEEALQARAVHDEEGVVGSSPRSRVEGGRNGSSSRRVPAFGLDDRLRGTGETGCRPPLVHDRGSGYSLYMSTPATVSVSEARQQLAEIIDRARAEHTPIYLARRGRRVAAVIDADDLDGILELAEDMADVRAAEAARAEMRATGETPIPWEQVKADLGLV